MLGQFLEFSVTTPDVLDSLGFYKLLGFTELTAGDVWPHRYAVVSDGDITIGLHDESREGPALTFVQRDLASQARAMADSGIEFDVLRIDEDAFNEASFRSPGGHRVSMIPARTYSRAIEEEVASVCGNWLELTLPSRDALRAARFWAPLAPEVLRFRETPTAHVRFHAAGLPLGVSESIAVTAPALCFRCRDRDAVWIALAKFGFPHEEHPGYEGAFMRIDAPEGTPIFLFDEDFLGESYEVVEGAAAD